MQEVTGSSPVSPTKLTLRAWSDRHHGDGRHRRRHDRVCLVLADVSGGIFTIAHGQVSAAGRLGGRAYTPPMERPIDAVTSSVLRLQVAQRAVNTLVQEVIERVSAEPDGASSLPHARIRLSELRSEVDEAVDALIDALARLAAEPRSSSIG
jgi:hypothetical protein